MKRPRRGRIGLTALLRDAEPRLAGTLDPSDCQGAILSALAAVDVQA